MYAVAERLDPDSYHPLATAVYAEMALAGITAVGEFHYLHHQPDGTPYADPNAMGDALGRPATRRASAIALLDTCYLSGGFGSAPEGRAGPVLATAPLAGVGAARAGTTARAAPRSTPSARCRATRCTSLPRPRSPLHVHLSEQVAENEACLDDVRPDARRSCSTPKASSGRDHGRPRHPPHRRGHRDCWATTRTNVCILPDHRTRPRRRDRARPDARRRGLPTQPRAVTATP